VNPEPQVGRDEGILRRRAERLARTKDVQSQRTFRAHVALLEAGDQIFGLPVARLREIVETPSVTPLPRLPAALRGIAQVRGELLAVADLATLLGLDKPSRPGCLAVLVGERGTLGLQATRTVGFRDIYEEELSGGGEGERPLLGVTRDLVTLLDVDRLLANEQLVPR